MGERAGGACTGRSGGGHVSLESCYTLPPSSALVEHGCAFKNTYLTSSASKFGIGAHEACVSGQMV